MEHLNVASFIVLGLLLVPVVVVLLHRARSHRFGPLVEFLRQPHHWWRRALTGSALSRSQQERIKAYVNEAKEGGHDPQVFEAMNTKWVVKRGHGVIEESE